MKKITVLLTGMCLISFSSFAGGKFQNVSESEVLPDSAAGTVIRFVKAANSGEIEKAKTDLSSEYLDWRERFGGIEKHMNYFEEADLSKTFQFRMVAETSNRAEITVRLFSLPNNAEQNYRIYVSKIGESWKITRK